MWVGHVVVGLEVMQLVMDEYRMSLNLLKGSFIVKDEFVKAVKCRFDWRLEGLVSIFVGDHFAKIYGCSKSGHD